MDLYCPNISESVFPEISVLVSWIKTRFVQLHLYCFVNTLMLVSRALLSTFELLSITPQWKHSHFSVANHPRWEYTLLMVPKMSLGF